MNVIDANIPIFARIAEGIKDHILTGDLKEGEQLPSTTQISKEYDINIATVNKAFNVLVSEGIVFKKRGIGMFVCEGSVQKLIEDRRKTYRDNYVRTALEEGIRLRYTVEELQAIVLEVYREINS
ncbi:MAG: GntR family transcriptional regulator [Ruminococcus sp.]|nr:GntR family transcriptional regulator [Ruminococcus sp.]